MRGRRFNRTLMIANSLMIPAALSQRILIQHWHVADGPADFVTGLLYGLVIGCYIVGIRKMVREDRGLT